KTRNYLNRMVEAVGRVATPYVAMCADDDLIFVDSALRCAEFLERNEDYIACHGVYAGFSYSRGRLEIESIVYDGASIDCAEMTARLIQLYSRYEATFYAVFRTSTQLQILES